MSKNTAKTAVLSAHYGYKFLETNATRIVSESERNGIKRMKKKLNMSLNGLSIAGLNLILMGLLLTYQAGFTHQKHITGLNGMGLLLFPSSGKLQ